MCLSATIRRPLRSKRAMISPVRPRAKASGFTRIRVRSIRSFRWASSAGLPGPRSHVRRQPPVADSRGDCLLLRVGGAAAARRRLADLGLAVRADLPARVERLAARRAGLLEPPETARAAQEALLDVEVAIGAGQVVHVGQPGLGG